jgi:hypothetical protein
MTAVVHAMSGLELGTVEVAEPEFQTRARLADSDTANDWLCAWCHHRVASEKDRHFHDGQSEFSFKNPAGIRFQLITFARADGCRQAGVPTLEHTWFAGHAWSFCLCERCGTHLGWFYAGPTTFVGLIRDRIVRAAVVMN